MKASTIISRSLASVIFVLVCGISSATNHTPVIFHNDATQDGKVISREVYEQNSSNGNLIPVKKLAFEYNETNDIISKATYKWNYDNKKWEKESFVTFDRNGNKLSVELAVWNKYNQTFIPAEKYIYITGEKDNLLAHYTYKNNSKSSEWILQKKVETPVYTNIYADAR